MMEARNLTSRLGFIIASSAGAAALLGTALQPAAAADAEAASVAILDRYVAAFNAHDLAAFSTSIADGFVEHNGRGGQGLTGLQATFRSNFQTWPDFDTEVKDRIVAGDRVVSRNLMTATHTRPVQLPGTPVFQPTGNHLSWFAINIWRVADGKFVEHWDVNDFVTMLGQMRAA